MCVQEDEQVDQDNDNMEKFLDNRRISWPLHCDLLHAQMDNSENDSSFGISNGQISVVNSFPLESICEDAVITEKNQNLINFVPALRSGEWSDIGGRPYMEDTHICIGDLAKKFGYNDVCDEAVSFYGVFDGHGGKSAAQFVRDHLPRVIVEDADFPLELEKVVTRSFLETDSEFAKTCSAESSLSSGTTALTAIIFGRSLLVANAGDCRAVLSRAGGAIEMSKDHNPLCMKERMRIESLGGFVNDGYLNGQLGVTRALGNWHLEGMKEMSGRGPLSAEPELKLMTLTKDDEFLIIGSDGIWEVFRSQNAVDFARRRIQQHNDVKQCCKEIIGEAIKRGATDNLTVVMVCFHSDPPPPMIIERPSRFRRSISAEGLQNLKCLLEG
ncbi:unnamed protein product [Lathyrus sativus]|nr:unnamed protein product [Lathyrus sativus]